ncbi:MAG: hypothetical protein Q8R02_24665 [Hyphomonadaceae bacterium]|nr:hypothetical protein [Hyphomonadaceae bacterium]
MQTGLRRTCEGCTLCCKVLRIDELAKPANQMCIHATAGGCAIHGSHPETCRVFFCLWIDDRSFGPEWKPDRSHFVMSRSASGKGLFLNVDIDTPDAWKAEPYYSALKRLASGARVGNYIAVSVGARCFAVFPEEDLEVCDLGPGCEIMVGYRDQPGARQPFAMVKVADGAIHTYNGQVYRN